MFTVHLIKVAQCGAGENEERMPLAVDEDDYQAFRCLIARESRGY